ncbi:MAG: hypothetical protein ABMA02_08040 [Saprospiraceae bacterium]
MSLSKLHHRIERLDQLIRQRRTGPARQIAEQLGIRERTFFELLECMRDMGADIRWCSQRRSYYHARSGYFRFGWVAAEEVSAPPPKTKSEKNL